MWPWPFRLFQKPVPIRVPTRAGLHEVEFQDDARTGIVVWFSEEVYARQVLAFLNLEGLRPATKAELEACRCESWAFPSPLPCEAVYALGEWVERYSPGPMMEAYSGHTERGFPGRSTRFSRTREGAELFAETPFPFKPSTGFLALKAA